MILPDGTFLPYQQVIEAMKDAITVEIVCTHCKKITSSEPLGDDYWLCYECGTVYKT